MSFYVLLEEIRGLREDIHCLLSVFANTVRSREVDLPDYLRRTWNVLDGEMTATDVSNFSRRSRAVESHYLNVLCQLGLASKRKVGRHTYYQRLMVDELESGNGRS